MTEATTPSPDPAAKPRDRIIDAFLAALARRRWDAITLSEIADDANVSLAGLRERFASRTSILRAFIKRTDAAVLRAIADDGDTDEEPRERLFDVLMTRFEHLKPYRDALRSVRDHARRDAGFALKMGGQGLVSATWMLEAAGIPSSGRDGGWRVAGLPYVWGRAFEVFLKDDDPGLARTMATLDRQLRKAEQRDAGIRRLRDRLRGFLDASPARRRRTDPYTDARADYERGFDAETASGLS